MIGKISVIIGGVLTLVIALFHTQFYKQFQWKDDFDKIGGVKSKIYYSIHLALLLLFFGSGLLSIIYAEELANSNGLGFGFMILLSVFWLWRTIWQIFYFNLPKKLRKRLGMHYLLIVIFALLFVAYSLPLIIRWL